MTTIHLENMKCALLLAIRKLEESGLGQSAQCAGFRENLEALERGEELHVIP